MRRERRRVLVCQDICSVYHTAVQCYPRVQCEQSIVNRILLSFLCWCAMMLYVTSEAIIG